MVILRWAGIWRVVFLKKMSWDPSSSALYLPVYSVAYLDRDNASGMAVAKVCYSDHYSLWLPIDKIQST